MSELKIIRPDLTRDLRKDPVVGGGPGIIRQAANLARAGAKWIQSGAKFASADAQRDREVTCLSCDLWDSAGNAGLGKCRHMACGCTRAKWKLASSQCPLTPPKWTRTDT